MPSTQENVDKYNELLSNMAKTKEKWDEQAALEVGPAAPQDEQDYLLSQAIEMAIEQGRGWSPGEKEAYLETILDDDFIPPMFASSAEEVAKSGLQEAFTSLIYDGESPTALMLQFRKKGNEAFANGKRNQVQNMQYYRDAINHYQESLAWAEKIEPLMAGDLKQADVPDDEPTYTPTELEAEKSTICSNIALMHIQLKNWGLAKKEAHRALDFNKDNVKALYRLAKACQMLQQWEEAGDAIDHGLEVDGENKDLRKLQQQLEQRVRKARSLRQQRERARAQRTAQVKAVWKHCNTDGSKIRLGRVPLVSSVLEEEADDAEEWRWHHHLPHSGQLPSCQQGEWTWPCMFLYPSHKQSDFIKDFGENEMIAMRMAQMFPELEHEDDETAMAWDFDNQFTCSQLAVYFEVHEQSSDNTNGKNGLIHPESVELLKDQASCMRFYESSRALKGDEGPEMANVVQAVERSRLAKQQNAWKKVHGSIWANRPSDSTIPVVRIHPAVCLKDVLHDERLVAPNVSVLNHEVLFSLSAFPNISFNIRRPVPGYFPLVSRKSPISQGLLEGT